MWDKNRVTSYIETENYFLSENIYLNTTEDFAKNELHTP